MRQSSYQPKPQPRSSRRRTRLYLVKAFSIMSVSALLLFPLPSFAGQWVVTYSEDQAESYLVPDPNNPGQTTPGGKSWYTPVDVFPWWQTSPGNQWYESGNLSLTATDKVVATFTWTPAYGQTMTTDPPPAKLTLLETAHSYWEATLDGYSLPSDAGQADDGLKDSEVFTIPPGTHNGKGTSSGSHLIQVDGSSGVVMVPCTLSATNPTSSWVAGQNPNDPYTSGYTAGYWDWCYNSFEYAFNVVQDSRAVTISADVDPTSYKDLTLDFFGNPLLDADGNQTFHPEEHIAAHDGSMTGDIGQRDTPAFGSGVPSDYKAYVTYKANRLTGQSWAIYESTDAWASSLTNGSMSETLNSIYGLEIGNFVVGYARPEPPYIVSYDVNGNPIYSADYPGVTGTDNIKLTYTNGTYYVPGYPASSATGAASTDSASATATYTMNVHHEYENPVSYRADHPHKNEVAVYLDTPARSGVDQTFKYQSPGATLAGDLLNQGDLSLLLLTAPEWVSKLFEMTELTADKLVPEAESGNTSFDATWSHPGSDWVGRDGVKTTTPPPISDYGNYQMQPAILEGFVTKYVRQDHYVPYGDASGVTGFAGQKDEQTDARTGFEQGIGHYTWVDGTGG